MRENDSSGADDIRLHGLLTSLTAIGLVRGAADVASPTRIARLGTLGLQSFSTDLLFLDFKRERLGIVPNPIAKTTWPANQTVSVDYAGDYIIVPLRASPRHSFRAVFDSGLSPFPLWASPDEWARLTGRTLADPGNRRYELPHPTGRLAFVGALTREPIRIGTVTLGTIEVVTLRTNEATPGGWPFPAETMIGPSAFAGKLVLGLDLRRKLLLVTDR